MRKPIANVPLRLGGDLDTQAGSAPVQVPDRRERKRLLGSWRECYEAQLEIAVLTEHHAGVAHGIAQRLG